MPEVMLDAAQGSFQNSSLLEGKMTVFEVLNFKTCILKNLGVQCFVMVLPVRPKCWANNGKN